jgi:type VI secretion system secreted protein VgrG
VTIEGGNITVTCPGKITIKAGTKSFVGPAQISYPMPTLPRSTLADKPFNFDLRTTDSPGPNGAPLPGVRWRIVVASDDAAARTATQSLLSDQSGSDGKVILSEADNKTLLDTCNQHPGRVWLVYRGKARIVAAIHERDEWTDGQRLEHALDAMGYSDTLGATGDEFTDRNVQSLGRTEHKVSAASALLNKIKG